MAQGSYTGPLLALIPIIQFLSQQLSVSYADDGLFYGDKPFEVKDYPELGIFLHKKKLGWVKWDGKYIKPLKFLGLTWNGKYLRASTRKGSTLLADNMKSAWSFVSSKSLHTLKQRYELSWEAIFKAQFGGTVLSKLYSGQWNMDEVFRSVRFNIPKKSILRGMKEVEFYNASSYASFTLIRIMTNEEKSVFNQPCWSDVRNKRSRTENISKKKKELAQ